MSGAGTVHHIKLRHGGEPAPLPFFLSKQTFANAIGMSVEGQEATYALQQIATYSITSSALASVAIAEEPARDLPFRLLRVPEPLASLVPSSCLTLAFEAPRS